MSNPVGLGLWEAPEWHMQGQSLHFRVGELWGPAGLWSLAGQGQFPSPRPSQPFTLSLPIYMTCQQVIPFLGGLLGLGSVLPGPVPCGLCMREAAKGLSVR